MEKEIYNFFKNKGYTHHQVIGIIANLREETGGFNPNVVSGKVKGDSGKAVGLAQWHPDRQAKFSKKFGRSLEGAPVAMQLEFIDYELKNHEKDAYNSLKNAKTVKDSTLAFGKYERYAGFDSHTSPSSVRRLNHAGQYSKKIPNNQSSNSKPMNEELLNEWRNYNNELATVRKNYTGSDRDKQENKLVKKYTDKGFIGSDANGEATGPFNNLIMQINKNKWRDNKTDAEATFRVANNLSNLLGTKIDKTGGRSYSLNYIDKNGKNYISKESNVPTLSLNADQKKDLEVVLGKKIDDKTSVSTINLLTKLQSKLKDHGQNVQLINSKDNSRGKDLAFENSEGSDKTKQTFSPSQVYIPDFSQGNQGNGIMGLKISNSYNPKEFKYDPKNSNYKKLNYIVPGQNWEIDDSTVTEVANDAAATADPYIDSSASNYTENNYNPNLSYNALSDGSAENKRLAELGQKDKSKWTAAEKEEFDRLSQQQESNAGIGKMMETFANSEMPTQYNYDPSAYKQSVPYAEIASSMFGIMTGMDMADNELPQRNEQVSAAYMSYAGELQRLSEIGLRPEDEAYAKRMLSESYSSGVEQIVHASGGNRNLVLGNLGRLDYQKQRGLLEIALADANAKNESFYKYGEAMKYVSEFDANKDIANSDRQYQNAMLNKQAGGELMSAGWKSLMDNINYYEQNKPGSANHAYKSYMMQQMFDFDPNKKDDGSGTVPGTKSYKDKIDKENLVRYTQNKEMGEKYGNLSPEKQIEFNRIAMQKGYGNESKGLLDFLAKNDVGNQADLGKYNEAKKSGNWASLFQQSENNVKAPEILNQEQKSPDKMFPVSTEEMAPLPKAKIAEVKFNPSSPIPNTEIKFPELSLPNYDLMPKTENNIGSDLFSNIEKQAQQNQNMKTEINSFLQNQSETVNTVMNDRLTIEEQNKKFRELLNQ
jgi:hypothetical protein